MCFGNKQKQGSDNRCGGYALDAVLTDLKISATPNPVGAYNEIQDVQTEKMGNSPVSTKFIDNTLKNGTAMSLPSSIALTAQNNHRLNVTVYIDEKKLAEELGMGGEKLITEEQTKLVDMVNNSTSPVAKAESFGASHFIVLVYDARHWVAVKKESPGKYTCYDPGTGECVTKSTLSEAVGFERMNSLIIALK